jgi:hypothetical protein
LVYGFGLACVTGDCDSLIDMQGAAVAKHLAFIEYDLALINTVRSSLLKNFCPQRLTFFVNRIRSPIDSAICFRSNTLNFGASSGGSLFFNAVLSENDSFLLTAKDLTLLAAFKSLFFDSVVNGPLGIL